MSKVPYFNVFPSDFLAGIVDLEGDEIGAYWVVILLMQDRGGPIPDEAPWIARRAGISTRRWGIIRAKLIKLGKLKARAGMLANPRAMRDIEKRERISGIKRSAAMVRWHADESPELALGDEIGEIGDKPIKSRKRRKSANSDDAYASDPPEPDPKDQKPDYLEKNGQTSQEPLHGKSEQIPQNSAENGDAYASEDSRARARSIPITKEEEERTNAAPSPPTRARARAPDPPDLDALLKLVSEASGFWPTTPGHRAKALEFIGEWVGLGIDIEAQAIPIIERDLAERADKTTGSLARFDRKIRAEYAAAKASAKHPRPPAAPDAPAGFDDPDERLEQIRIDLKRDLGARTYASWLMPAAMTVEGSILIVTLPSAFLADWVLGHFAERFRLEAQRHGFTEVRIGAKPP